MACPGKIDLQGNKLDDSPFPLNQAGFVIHSASHAAREDVGCVLHTQTRAGVAVSAQRCGVLPISQQSTLVLASLACHDDEGVAIREDEPPRLQADLGDKPFLCLRKHGLLTVGKGTADAFLAGNAAPCRPSNRPLPRPAAWAPYLSGPATCASWTGAVRAMTAELQRQARPAAAPSMGLLWRRARVAGWQLVHNVQAPWMQVDAQTGAVRADGLLLCCEAAAVPSMAQRSFPF